MYLIMTLVKNIKTRKALGNSLIIASILFISIMLNGCSSVKEYNTSVSNGYESQLKKNNTNLKLTDIDTGESEVEKIKETSLDDIKSIIDEEVKVYNEDIAVYYYNFNTKEQYSVNENIKFLSASLKKLPQVMEILDKVANGEITLDTEIEYNYDMDYANGTGTLQFEEVIGKRKIGELVELAILESDNIAYNMLKRFCNNDLVKYMRELTGDNTIEDEEYIKLTAKNNFDILYKLYINEKNNPYYPYLIDLMKKTTFHDRLDKYLPDEKVAHKIGSYYRYYHDAGIIYGDNVYILVIMTKDIGQLTESSEFKETDEERFVIDMGEEACELIACISKDIYRVSPGIQQICRYKY